MSGGVLVDGVPKRNEYSQSPRKVLFTTKKAQSGIIIVVMSAFSSVGLKKFRTCITRSIYAERAHESRYEDKKMMLMGNGSYQLLLSGICPVLPSGKNVTRAKHASTMKNIM